MERRKWGEVYWLLSTISELLVTFKSFASQLDQGPTDSLFVDAALTGMRVPVDLMEEDKYIRQIEPSVDQDRASAFAYCLGTALQVVRKKSWGQLSQLQSQLSLAERFLKHHRYNEATEVIFYLSAAIDLASQHISAEKNLADFCSELKSLLNELLPHFKELDAGSKIRALYIGSILELGLPRVASQEFEDDIKNILEAAPLELLAFILRPLVQRQLTVKHETLLRISNHFRERDYGKAERRLISKVLSSLLSYKPVQGVEIKEVGESENPDIELRLTLSPDEVAGLAKPRIQQLAMVALGLVSAGYYSVYTLPLIERKSYSDFVQFSKDKLGHRLVEKGKVEEACRSLAQMKYTRGFCISLVLAIMGLASTFLTILKENLGLITPAGIIILVVVLSSFVKELQIEGIPLWQYLTSRKELKKRLTEHYQRMLFGEGNVD